MSTITVRRLGTTPYLQTLERMRAFTSQRIAARAAVGDELWLTEHPAVYTLGFASRPEHLLDPGSIPVIETERGGQVTYHGPGQILAYLLLDLRRRKLGPREMVRRLEDGVIDCLAGCGVAGFRRPGAPGIFVARTTSDHLQSIDSPDKAQTEAGLQGGISSQHVDEPGGGSAKIASIGLKISRGLTWHGLALNAGMDLAPFTRIEPCGFPGLEVTDIRREVGANFNFSLDRLADDLAQAVVNSIER